LVLRFFKQRQAIPALAAAAAMSTKTLTILGSTGSIGCSALDVVRRFPGEFRVHALAAHSSVDRLADQVEQVRPSVAVLYEERAADELRRRRPAGGRTAIRSGMAGLLEVATERGVDLVLAGMVGAVGLEPAYAAIGAGKQLALANKEVMVLAGEFMMRRAQETGSRILPVDSEHNAIFQCLAGAAEAKVQRILLTGSGGPFRDLGVERFGEITVEQALKHPNWTMGPKITIDSATMMNKGLEVIEARWLFGLPAERIEVLIHRQSIVHSLVEFVDGSVIAQLGLPDMRTPIAYCLAWPDRLPLDLPRLSLAQVGRLDFEEIQPRKYPCLFLALDALKRGGGAPAALNGANEEVVAAYLSGAFPFPRIAGILAELMARLDQALAPAAAPTRDGVSALRDVRSVADALAADRWGREQARALIASSAAS
jgi:1-deoxy-D-xylulose-5-phosphate reductoisomerase